MLQVPQKNRMTEPKHRFLAITQLFLDRYVHRRQFWQTLALPAFFEGLNIGRSEYEKPKNSET